MHACVHPTAAREKEAEAQQHASHRMGVVRETFALQGPEPAPLMAWAAKLYVAPGGKADNSAESWRCAAQGEALHPMQLRLTGRVAGPGSQAGRRWHIRAASWED